MKAKSLSQWARTQARWYWFEQIDDGSETFEDWLAGFKTPAELKEEVGDYCPELWG